MSKILRAGLLCCAAIAALADMSSAFAQESLAFRPNPLKSPPAAIALAHAIAAQPVGLDPEIFPPATDPSDVASFALTREVVDERDFALEMLGEPQRVLAYSLEKWRRSPSLGFERRRLRAKIAELYAARDFSHLWRGDGERWSAAARAVEKRLRQAADDGLDLRAYKIPSIDAAQPSGARAGADEADDIALSEAVAAYVAQAAGARVDPERISRLIGERPSLPDTIGALTRIADAGLEAGELLQSYNPPHYGYQQLRAKLAELRAGRSLDSDGLLAATSVSDPFDAADQQAGKAARRRKASGADSPSRVEGEILANMERWRWLPRDLGASRVEVNIPEFELAVVRDGMVAHRAKVIVGKEETPTPIFSNALQSVIVNPSWYVPQSIIRKEMLPKYGGDFSALAKRGWKVGHADGKLTLRQPPGEGNALGRIKFIFPNDFSVYMHDTPSRELFASEKRAFSHGCMRVEDPFALAEAVLGPNSGWSEARVRRLVGSSERYINLASPLPIHIEYFTAFVDEFGRLQLREDLYGYSARVRRELGLGG